jgi:hypothetical protein
MRLCVRAKVIVKVHVQLVQTFYANPTESLLLDAA